MFMNFFLQVGKIYKRIWDDTKKKAYIIIRPNENMVYFINELPNIAAEWLALLLRIHEDQGWNLGPETDNLVWLSFFF
jgi:hypothetical protein